MSAMNSPTSGSQSTDESDGLSNQLYNNIIVADYRSAVTQTPELENDLKGEIIRNVINRLLVEEIRNTMEYASRLWDCGSEDIVKKYFPFQFRLILDNKLIKIISRRDNMALKLQYAQDRDGDRQSYGDGRDKTSSRLSWKMFSVWDKNRVYFKIFNTYENQYLKLEIAKDWDGDHKACGATKDDTYRHQWYLQPAKYEQDILFYIYNREYDQVLKLGRSIDGDGDRMLWSHNGNTTEGPLLYGWKILPM